MTTAYVESSALTKLVLDEHGSEELRSALRHHEHVVSSDLTCVEVTRASARARGEQGVARARAALLPIASIPIDRAIIDAASRLEPSTLRSLDAIHVATALALGTEHVTFYSYDSRTIEAARSAGLAVATPSP